MDYVSFVDDYAHQNRVRQRYLSPTMLFVACLLTIAGFVFTAACTMFAYLTRHTNEFGKRYPSGYGWFPSNVSEGVSLVGTTQYQIFFATCFMAGITLFLSWYPYNLQNVSLGNLQVFCTPLYWNSLRHLITPLGLFLTGTVPTKPDALSLPIDGIATGLHATGAACLFLGYFICELKTLLYPRQIFKKDATSYADNLDISGCEKIARLATCAFGITTFLIFFGLYGLDQMLTDDILCCADKWQRYNMSVNVTVNGTLRTLVKETGFLEDTASGWRLRLKMAAYFCECFAFVGMVCNMLSIWFFCHERLPDYHCKPLADVWNTDHEIPNDRELWPCGDEYEREEEWPLDCEASQS